ncbi:unnamed protein product [Rhizophagus irregularis]|uniref:Uncharacterized protein n=1 Tax=Rhizophagus irregularis TaxID=588596 RepID=A0A916DZI7_9GLOM|nr:unnamed protein product [Rhizophagus irregularis]CAB5339185.1 unnamed protein product [Rhizophagus irregularis]
MSQHVGSRKTYNECFECARQRTAVAWYDFIKYTQLNAKESMDYLEWINFDQFDLIENINKRGAFSSIYSAVWMEGPKWNLDEEAELWTRTGPIKVILKRLDNSQNMDHEFINQIRFFSGFVIDNRL